MEKKFIIADSGGSKTHWIMSDEKTYKEFFSSGLHPKEITPAKEEEVKALFNAYDLSEYVLYFYGTGCLREENQTPVKELLTTLGFNETHIYGDVVGSCRAALADAPGDVLILGTGSVGLKYDGEKITETFGGLGYPHGDEGSGARMGKMLIEGYQHKTLSPELIAKLEAYKTNISFPLNTPVEEINRKEIATLSKFLFEHKAEEEVQSILRTSFQEMYTTTVEPMHTNSISVTGSIAFYFKDELKDFLFSKQIVVNRIVKYPALNLYSLHFNQHKGSLNQ
ncbi:BadF-type ATPase [Lishizhenia tianjinensis]|uniref:BadF-type ATPase n=1 Tax=Lishizhenia tianjinensis TaxID=477690 RepID=A0A1I7AFU1_9FLAO|nr:hypothetical protein [Lishizhenia tianjinensis]SFT73753.1 BadF-type ATPase [Lishizhenia tianjinensis]